MAQLLDRLSAQLRSDQDVRLAVLFGSTALGNHAETSDVDLLIVDRRGDDSVSKTLRWELSELLGRRVHLVHLDQARLCANLLVDVLDEGRVIVDRDNLWRELGGERARIFEAAVREDRELLARAHAAADAARDRVRSGKH